LLFYIIRLRSVYVLYIGHIMGIVKISDELHEEIRKASTAMVRSINSQSEYWIKIGMLAELNPTMTYSDIIKEQLRLADVKAKDVRDE
jgi:hypothetical protein